MPTTTMERTPLGGAGIGDARLEDVVPQATCLEHVVASVGTLVDGLEPRSLSPAQRTAWLRALSRLDGLVAAGRSRLLSPDPTTRAMPPAERTAELVRTTGMSGADARRAVRLADTLQRVPAAATALAEGAITEGHATALSRGVSRHHRGAAAADPGLVAAARSQTVDEFAATLAEWERTVDGDPDGRMLAADQHRRRRAGWSTGPDGMVRIDAELAPDAGSVVTGMLQALSEELWRTQDGRPSGTTGDGRTTPQRHADALEEMARRAGGRGDGSAGHRTRTDLVVTVDLDRLRSAASGSVATVPGEATSPMAAPGRCATADGVALTPAAVRRLACDAGVVPAVLGSHGEVLDVGRRTRTVGGALRRALLVRDGGCAHPGCDRPVSWCDAHHVHHWADGGPTSLDNLVLLCSAHHHLVHEGGWSIRVSPDGRHRFRSPTGVELTAGPSPGALAEPSPRERAGPRPQERAGPGP